MIVNLCSIHTRRAPYIYDMCTIESERQREGERKTAIKFIIRIKNVNQWEKTARQKKIYHSHTHPYIHTAQSTHMQPLTELKYLNKNRIKATQTEPQQINKQRIQLEKEANKDKPLRQTNHLYNTHMIRRYGYRTAKYDWWVSCDKIIKIIINAKLMCGGDIYSRNSRSSLFVMYSLNRYLAIKIVIKI